VGGDGCYAGPVSGNLFAVASALLFGAGFVQAVSTIMQGLPMPQSQNFILIVLGVIFLVAFFVANEPRRDQEAPTR
jgi:hypothetical protein